MLEVLLALTRAQSADRTSAAAIADELDGIQNQGNSFLLDFANLTLVKLLACSSLLLYQCVLLVEVVLAQELLDSLEEDVE